MSYLKFGFLVVLVTLLYYPEISFMINEWSNDYWYSHGFLIPLISGYVIWRKRDVLKATPAMPEFKGFFVLLAGISLLMIGYVAFEPFIRRYSIIITIMGLIYFLLGKRILKILLFPVGYLMFMIPMPYIMFKSMAVHLRVISTKVTYSVIELFGIPIIQEGTTLQLPNVTLEVIDWCTGIQSIIAVTAIAVLYAYFTQRSSISRIILVLLAIPIAIIGNMFRLVITVCLAYFYGESVLKGIVHQFQGTINFLFTLFLLVIAGGIVERIEIKLSRKKT